MTYYKKNNWNKKQENYDNIGVIYGAWNNLFDRANQNLTQANVAEYEAEFNGIMQRAKQVMNEEWFQKNGGSNSRRWERIKKEKGVTVAVQPQNNPVQPTFTQTVYLPEVSNPVNHPTTTLPISGGDVEYYVQIIRNLQMIIEQKNTTIEQQNRMISQMMMSEKAV